LLTSFRKEREEATLQISAGKERKDKKRKGQRARRFTWEVMEPWKRLIIVERSSEEKGKVSKKMDSMDTASSL
jgi:hypothetical protein